MSHRRPVRCGEHPGTGDLSPADPRSAFTRREFLGASLAAVSTVWMTPSFIQRSAFAAAGQQAGQPVGAKSGVLEDRVLVVVELAGGNDGLNTVVPYRDDAYYRKRPSIAIPANEVLRMPGDPQVALHPAMDAVAEMMEQGRASVVQGAGYPNPNRSHFVSMDIWHTADPRAGRGLGWIGKALDQAAENAPQADHSADCVAIGDTAPLAAQGRRTKPVNFDNPNLFRWVGSELHPALESPYQKLQREARPPASRGPTLMPTESAPDQAAFLARTAMNAQVASERMRRAVDQNPLTSFPGNSLGRQLQKVAAMIRAELPTRIYYVRMGGFDTHAGQPGRHNQLLSRFSDSVAAFYRELDAMGQADRVLTMGFSEFGRRVRQNASGGTDHGAAGPMFFFGPRVRAGVLGNAPSLETLDRGDLIHTVDFRSVYAGVMKDWLGVEPKEVLGDHFRPARIVA